MGKENTPVRKLFDYGLEHFLKDRPLLFALTVTTAPGGVIHTHGLFLGEGRRCFTEAVKLAQEKNIDFVPQGLKKCVVYLDPSEFKSTWLRGRLNTLEQFKKPENQDLRDNMGAAAHLIHGSSDGRFTITYAVKDITKAEIKGVGFEAADYDEMARRYDSAKLQYGYNTVDGEQVYFIPNPALGLWIDRERFEKED